MCSHHAHVQVAAALYHNSALVQARLFLGTELTVPATLSKP